MSEAKKRVGQITTNALSTAPLAFMAVDSVIVFPGLRRLRPPMLPGEAKLVMIKGTATPCPASHARLFY